MSHQTVQQVKKLIISDLSLVEKAHLIEWIGTDLKQTLALGNPAQPDPGAIPVERNEDTAHSNGTNGFISHRMRDGGEDQAGLSWEERPWTEAELRELMRPDPKTGAEIVALLDRLELSDWETLDIPDVVEWVKEQRRQETQRRTLQWAELP